MLATNRPPIISILIAARNEEATIVPCLQAIAQLQYPPDAFEVLIGNDQSTDQTSLVVAKFIADKPQFRLLDISETVAHLVGKANVLAQLAHQATGQYLFFTDADTQVPVSWLTEISQQFDKQIGIVTGITLPKGPTLFHKLQTIDWLYNLTLTHLLSRMTIPVTAMGNNMAVSREAYQAVGGYASLPFSVVEDYTLFQAITHKGFAFRNLLDVGVLATTKPVDTLHEFLHQRKRWMRGAMDLPAWIVIALYVQYLAGPLFIALSLVAPLLAVSLFVARWVGQTTVILFGLKRLRQTKLWPFALIFDIYQLMICPLSVLFYFLWTPIDWKGRTYK